MQPQAAMEPVAVWHGRHGDPVPLFGPLPGIRNGQAIAYEFALPESFEPRPGRTRLQRTFLLTDVGVALALPCWRRTTNEAGDVIPGVDPDHDEPAWYIDLMHVTDRGHEVVARDLYIDVMIPTDSRHQRQLDLDEFADAIEDGSLPTDVAIDGLRRWQRFLDTYVHRDRDPRAAWSDFPPKAIEDLAALPSPLGPVVTWQG
ncbi:MAG TPA: DUF402 domain-containing protein [Streptosporangiaceae bacterium]|nr:DUF402 domain-containing protein [Streptosporangiaceae bacterium]